MTTTLSESLGWVATGVFVASYFFRKPVMLRTTQMCGAALWILYGLLIRAIPVVVANVLVFFAAAWTVALNDGRASSASRPMR